MEYPYVVYSPSGQPVMTAPESCRYPRKIELSLLESGYTIRLHGKRLTKTEIRKDVKANLENKEW